MACVRVTLLLSCVLVSVCGHEVKTRPTLAHRHRHERSHQDDYEHDLDRFLNRLDNHLPATTATTRVTPTTQNPTRYEVPVTESNSLWEEGEETVGSSPTAWGLDSGRWNKILRKDEGKRLEDETEEESGEEDEEEDDSKGLTQQADSSRSWVSGDISQNLAGINAGS